jgi:hypothetical protein
MRPALDLASIWPIQLISFTLWLGLRVSLNSDGRIPTGRSNSLHDHHGNMKPIKTLIYICISPYAHIPNPKLSSYDSDITEGIWVATVVQNKIFYPNKPGTTAVIDHEITTRCADATEPSLCRRNASRVAGSAVAHVLLDLHAWLVWSKCSRCNTSKVSTRTEKEASHTILLGPQVWRGESVGGAATDWESYLFRRGVFHIYWEETPHTIVH